VAASLSALARRPPSARAGFEVYKRPPLTTGCDQLGKRLIGDLEALPLADLTQRK
jgi:hypothetical protein